MSIPAQSELGFDGPPDLFMIGAIHTSSFSDQSKNLAKWCLSVGYRV